MVTNHDTSVRNRILQTFATAVLLFAGLGAQAEEVQNHSVEMKVHGVVCQFCAQGIKKKINAMPGTSDVSVDLKTKVVAFKSTEQPEAEKLEQIIIDAGYKVVRMTVDGETVLQDEKQAKNSESE